jgi:hypothetical protein
MHNSSADERLFINYCLPPLCLHVPMISLPSLVLTPEARHDDHSKLDEISQANGDVNLTCAISLFSLKPFVPLKNDNLDVYEVIIQRTMK